MDCSNLQKTYSIVHNSKIPTVLSLSLSHSVSLSLKMNIMFFTIQLTFPSNGFSFFGQNNMRIRKYLIFQNAPYSQDSALADMCIKIYSKTARTKEVKGYTMQSFGNELGCYIISCCLLMLCFCVGKQASHVAQLIASNYNMTTCSTSLVNKFHVRIEERKNINFVTCHYAIVCMHNFPPPPYSVLIPYWDLPAGKTKDVVLSRALNRYYFFVVQIRRHVSCTRTPLEEMT